MKKGTGVLLTLLSFFAGIAIGILMSPIKGGVGNNTRNTNNYYNEKSND